MGKSRKSTIRKFEFYETITDNGIESGYVRLANTQFHSDAVIRRINFECKQGYKKRNLEGLYSIHRLDGEQAD